MRLLWWTTEQRLLCASSSLMRSFFSALSYCALSLLVWLCVLKPTDIVCIVLGYLMVSCVAGISQPSVNSNCQLVSSRIWQRRKKWRSVLEQRGSTAMDGQHGSPSRIDSEALRANSTLRSKDSSADDRSSLGVGESTAAGAFSWDQRKWMKSDLKERNPGSLHRIFPAFLSIVETISGCYSAIWRRDHKAVSLKWRKSSDCQATVQAEFEIEKNFQLFSVVGVPCREQCS